MFPLIATIAGSGGVIIDKIILSRQKINLKLFVTILFLFLFLFTIILVPFLGYVNSGIYELKNLTILVALIICALIWNYYYYKGIQSEKIQEFELFLMFQPLITIVLASIFLKSENNLYIEIAAVIASITLILTQIKRHHFELSRGAFDMLIAVIFMSIEIILIRLTLNFLSPVALYAIRTGIISLLFIFIWRTKSNGLTNKNILWIAICAILGTIQMITSFYGYQELGVVYTSLILILSPLIVNFASIYYFHEKLHLKKVVAAIVILACIVFATAMGK